MAKIKGNRNIFIVIGIILLFLLISLIYYFPVLEGKVLSATDTNSYLGASKEITDFRNETGEEALWTNRLFGGMPAYFISTKFSGDWLSKFQTFINKAVPRPASYLFLSFVSFFILCISLGLRPFVSMIGALMYGFSTFFFVLISAGHMTKANTLAYMGLTIAGILYAYRKNPIVGSIITAFGLSWMLSANHPQMTYYTGIMALIIGVTYLIYAVREKQLAGFVKSSVLLAVAVLLAVGTNFGRLYTSLEYSKYSIRGGSNLTNEQDNTTSGLDKDYILDYSYDLGEALTAFIPRLKGGGMSESLGDNSEVYQLLEQNQGRSTARQIAGSLPLYWGDQPIASAPFYFGAVLCFLFVFGLFVVKGKDKWWIAAVVIISFLLSLGKNFSILSNLMIDYFPGYNKFRDVKNIIVIQQFSMALLGVMAIRELYKKTWDKKELLKKLRNAWFITGGLALIFLIIPGLAGNFVGGSDAQLASAGWPSQLLDALQADRKMVLREDAFRSLVFVSLSAGIIWLYVKQKIKAGYALLFWGLLVLVDMWPIDKKYLNNDNFQTKTRSENPFTESVADQEILKDTDPDFRVLNLTVSVFQDASTSYFHNSIGGYHGAKLERYQELFEHQLSPEISRFANSFTSMSAIDSVLQTLSVINMLNTKYIIYNKDAAPIQNEYALGNAWFVDNLKMVNNADEEMAALGDFDPSREAVVDQSFSDLTEGLSSGSSEGSEIELTEYQPNKLTYSADVMNGTKLAVFSEIYYPAGWKAFIDGQETGYLRADYVLRALPVPQGQHEIEFRFEPSSYIVGEKVSMASSIILLLLAIGGVFYGLRKNKTVISEDE